MGRRKYTIRRVRWHLQIPETLAAEVELLLLDPFWQQPKWGAKSELVTQLLQDWLNKQPKQQNIQFEKKEDTA